MRILVIGVGLQGRAALFDLVRHQAITEVTAADRELGPIRDFCRNHDLSSAVRCVELDAEDRSQVAQLLAQEFDVVGRLEAFVNGDAVAYATALGLAPESLVELGRYVLRWPGHCSFWRRMVDLHLLDDEPLVVNRQAVDRRCLLATALEPHLGYADDEQDVAVVRVEVSGSRQGRPAQEVLQVVDRRDLRTGLFAMNRMVGFAAAIGAGMLAGGVISDCGLLSPLHHVPFQAFADELQRRGIDVIGRSSST
jgi:saccharopine dehydrogenase-like NADP-dependent oxidoreductase